MFPAPLFLALLIVTTPAILVFDLPILHGLVTAVAAVSVAIVALRIRPGEAGFLSSVIRPIAIIACVPALWMIVQVLPLKAVGLAHPIWESAAAALGRPLAGSISIDPGATLISLARFLSIAGIAFVAAAVAVDRNRAAWIFVTLTASTSLIASMILVASFGNFAFLSIIAGEPARDAATDSASLGAILAAAEAFHALGRARAPRAQRPDARVSAVWFWSTFVAYCIAIAICSMAVVLCATSHTYFAVSCGLATLGVAIVIRRFQFGLWGVSALASVALVFAIAAVARLPGIRPLDLTLSFTDRAPLIDLSQRVLAETPWLGAGAGTFTAAIPIYRSIDELAAGHIAPNVAVMVAVEMGQPFLWATILAATTLIVALLRDAARRGRDSIYSTAGASCIVTITLLAFGNAAVFSTPVLLVSAAIVGIAIAQRKSRRI